MPSAYFLKYKEPVLIYLYFVKVPGRMSMLVTIFLIVTTIYGSVEAPPSRGFSYIELWYIGVQIPIHFALLEYGIILAIMKYHGSKTKMENCKGEMTMGDTFKIIDLIGFICSLIFILVFYTVYIWLCTKEGYTLNLFDWGGFPKGFGKMHLKKGWQ